MLAPLLRKLMAMERPILEEHGLTMWGYVVLTALADTPHRTQAALAAAIGADKTRIISTLDDLQEQGYLARTPDPKDRRARLLAITESGQQIRRSAQEKIQEEEGKFLAALPPETRETFISAAKALSRAGTGHQN
jgi:DNA-binding MarR family transcriptional regulator